MKTKQEVIQQHTPAPWRWEFNEKSKDIQIVGGKPKYDSIVMAFVRYGMSSAQPRFNIKGLLFKASEMGQVVQGREHHQSWFNSISHPDALLMIKAPEMLEMLQAHIFALDNGQLAFYEKYGFNVSELSDRVRKLIESATTV